MTIYDVSVTLREGMPVYPGDAPFRRQVLTTPADGSPAVSALHMNAHHGTHVDAPRHMVRNGRTVDRIAPSVLVGPADVIAVQDRTCITRAELERHSWQGIERALFKTANSGRLEHESTFARDFVSMGADAAQFLADLDLLLVGVDYLTVDPLGSSGFPAHKVLLGSDVVIVEGLDLSNVPPGRYEMFCGVLKVKDADGAPARVLLRTL